MPVYYPACRAVLSVVFDGFGGDDTSPTVVQVLPVRASAILNSYKDADTFQIEFDARSFPFSPELIRGAAIELYMYETDGLQDDPEGYAKDENLVVTGLIDNATISYADSRFSLDGRDYTSLFIDKTWPPDKKVPIGLPLDQVIQNLANEAQDRIVTNPDTGKKQVFKALRPLQVQFIGETPPPIVGSTAGRDKKLTQKRVHIAPPKTAHGHSSASKHGIPFKSGQNYWDVIYKLCQRHGFIVFVRNTTIVISDPKTLQESTIQTVPKMAYGRNLETLSIERHLGKETVPQIVITCYDKSTRTSIEGKYPPNYKGKQTGFSTFKEEQRRYVVTGITDPAIVYRLARNLYHNLARSEGRLRFSTKDLKDLGETAGTIGPNSLLKLRAGGSVLVGFDPYNDSEMKALSTAQLRFARLKELGYTDTVAKIVAENYDKIKFRQPWYVRQAMLEWDTESGITIEAECVNFIDQKRDSAT